MYIKVFNATLLFVISAVLLKYNSQMCILKPGIWKSQTKYSILLHELLLCWFLEPDILCICNEM